MTAYRFMKYISIILLFLLLAGNLYSQNNEIITVTGDSLVGKLIEGESVREVYGNVVLRQGDVRITCNKAIQYISRNDAELIGNMIAHQDSLTIKTEHGFYYGNLRMSKSTKRVTLDDQKVILSADSGQYYFNESRAFFQSNVRLYDTTTTLTSNELTYFKNRDFTVATGLVKIVDAENIIEADSLEHSRKTKITFANSNVKITNLKNSTSIYGGHLEDYRDQKFTLINIDPVLMQIDSSSSFDEDSVETIKVDTLLINALRMESYRDTADIFIAIDSVKIVRGMFASKNDRTEYIRSDDKIITYKVSENLMQPVIWYENSQLTGDSIVIHLEDNKINMLEINQTAFLASQNINYPLRFDQTSAARIFIYFADNKIQRSEFFGNVYSIYNLFEGAEANGLTKSNSQDAIVYFEDNEVSEVRLYSKPVSEYYPENQVIGNERSFLLPKFVIRENKPEKDKLLNSIIMFDQKRIENN